MELKQPEPSRQELLKIAVTSHKYAPSTKRILIFTVIFFWGVAVSLFSQIRDPHNLGGYSTGIMIQLFVLLGLAIDLLGHAKQMDKRINAIANLIEQTNER